MDNGLGEKMNLRFLMVVLLLALVVLIVSACAGDRGTPQAQLTLAPESALPDFVKDAPPQVKEAYRFAIANPDVLTDFPCYCGCGAVGHMSNLQCYIQEVGSDGAIKFDNHAFG